MLDVGDRRISEREREREEAMGNYCSKRKIRQRNPML